VHLGGPQIVKAAIKEIVDRENAPATISFRLPPGASAAELPGEAAGATSQNGSVSFHSGDPVRTLHDLTEWALARNIDLEGLEVRRPTLEDIYLELTGGSE